jgi:hypothetical protein
MNITKSQLKQIIEEEMSAAQATINTAYDKALKVGRYDGPHSPKEQLEDEAKMNAIAREAGFKDYEALEKAYFARVKGFTGRKHRGDRTEPERAYDLGPEFDLRENKIKVTKTQLEQIIREELSGILKEDRHYQRYGPGSGYGPKVSMQVREVELALQNAGIVGVSLGDVTDIINAYKRSGKSALDQLEHLKDQLASRDYRFRAHKPMGDEVARDIDRLFEEKTYPNNSTMKKLVRQAKLDSRYEPNSDAQLKKDYDKHVRDTLRDPKHSQAHKK